jgi:predicted RNA binding protein YcfA (HicA-like mRNA interferase family)
VRATSRTDDGGVKVWAVIARVEADGWRLVSTKGSHRQFKHPEKPGRVTIPGKLRDDVHPKTLRSILRQAGLDQ